ncbi:MAG: HlyD family efflux transporter periplasmic adaptor subunit [Desulfomonilaceae bacterium]|nr:HlyD family efflux transporter periplasmic adaptor subunit [Desulfomonilaceae bacterium]
MKARPKFRKDLGVSEYPECDGSRTIVLKDPVSAKYYRLSTFEYQFLQSLDGTVTLEEAIEKFNASGRYCSLPDARTILGKAAQFGLILGTEACTARYQSALKKRQKELKRTARFSSVYFLFIPLLNPDGFLERTLWVFRLFANRWTIGAATLLIPGAGYLLMTGIGKIEREYLFFFNLENLFYLWITIALAKLVHEFSHAYTAKSFALHVPQMGIGFLIFFPCLYCNTTDAWQLADRKQRIAIGAAGIIAELILAVTATYVWYFSKPGMLNSLAFYLIAVSFGSTVLFNGNPLMRFDGYFILTDYLRVPNLMQKSFGYLRYLCMNRVLGMNQVPSTAGGRRERFLFASYGVSAFLFRIFLYTGIIAGVYYRFDKTLGVVLAAGALVLFVVRPTMRGIRTLYCRRSEVIPKPSGVFLFSVLLVLILGPLFVPVSTKSVYPSYVGSAYVQKLTVPFHTAVKEVFVKEGSAVIQGQTLFTLDTENLDLALTEKQIRYEIVRKELSMLRFDSTKIGTVPAKEMELYQVEDEAARIRADLDTARTGVTAPFNGIVTKLDFRMQTGFRPGQGVVVGEVQSPTDYVVRAFIPEHDRHRINVGQEIEIWLPIGTGRIVTERIDEIRSYSERDLKDLPFSSRLGGELATEVLGDRRRDVPLEAQYMCAVKLNNSDHAVRIGMTGRLVVPSPPKSMFSRFLDELFRTFNRESLV